MAATALGDLVQAGNGFLASGGSAGGYSELLDILKGLRNGAVYGAKVRASHALVTTFLFGRGSLRNKLWSIMRATYTHSRNLALFAFLYKATLAVMKQLQGKSNYIHPAIAGCVSGYLIFGENNKVNSQINMYILSRILFGLVRLAVKKKVIKKTKKDPFIFYAAVIHTIVMWLFEYHPDVLQPSLQSSMEHIYHDSS